MTTLWNLFTPNSCSPLALFHAAQAILGVQKLGANVNKLDGWPASGRTARIRDFCTIPGMIGLAKSRINRLGRLLGPTVSGSIFACSFQGIGEDRILTRQEIRMRCRHQRSGGIANHPLDHRFPKHALVSSTRFVVPFGLVQGVRFNGLNSTLDPVLMSFVFARIIRDAKELFHPFQASRLKRLTLISGKHDWTPNMMVGIPPESRKVSNHIYANREVEFR